MGIAWQSLQKPLIRELLFVTVGTDLDSEFLVNGLPLTVQFVKSRNEEISFIACVKGLKKYLSKRTWIYWNSENLEVLFEFPHSHLLLYLVDDTGFEPVTPSMSRKCATTAPIVRR